MVPTEESTVSTSAEHQPDPTLAEVPHEAPASAPTRDAPIDQLKPAIPAPSTEAETHVLVPNDHVNILHRLLDDVERGVEGAALAFGRAFRHVFHRDG